MDTGFTIIPQWHLQGSANPVRDKPYIFIPWGFQYTGVGCQGVISLLFNNIHPRLGRKTSQNQLRDMVGTIYNLNNIWYVCQDVELKIWMVPLVKFKISWQGYRLIPQALVWIHNYVPTTITPSWEVYGEVGFAW